MKFKDLKCGDWIKNPKGRVVLFLSSRSVPLHGKLTAQYGTAYDPTLDGNIVVWEYDKWKKIRRPKGKF